MLPRTHHRRGTAPPAWALLPLLALFVLPACSSVGDLGELKPSLVTDDIHDWVGRDAAKKAGAPVSTDNLTDDERALRDLAFPLIEPPYDRQRWDAVLYENGTKTSFKHEIWAYDRTAYYANLQATPHRSPAGRYSQLTDDIRNDIVRLDRFFEVAHRVVDADRQRELSMQSIADLSAPERLNAQARIGENRLTIAWVQHALTERCAGYRFALDRLAVAEPQGAAADADRVLTQLQQQIAAEEIVPPPHLAALAPPLPSAEPALAK